MPSWGKKTVFFLRVSSLLEQDCSCGQGFGKRVGSCKVNSKQRSGPTMKVLGKQGKGYGNLKVKQKSMDAAFCDRFAALARMWKNRIDVFFTR